MQTAQQTVDVKKTISGSFLQSSGQCFLVWYYWRLRKPIRFGTKHQKYLHFTARSQGNLLYDKTAMIKDVMLKSPVQVDAKWKILLSDSAK